MNKLMTRINSEVVHTVVLAALGLGGWGYVLAILAAAFDARTIVA